MHDSLVSFARKVRPYANKAERMRLLNLIADMLITGDYFPTHYVD